MEAAALWAIIRKFWPAIPIIGLAVALWFVREDDRRQAANAKAAQAQVQTVTAANAGLAVALKSAQANRADNDAIAQSVADKLQGNIRTVNTTKTVIQKVIASDPKAANWADTPIPVGLRDALRAN